MTATLLVDVGNTRVKWRVIGGEGNVNRVLAEGAWSHAAAVGDANREWEQALRSATSGVDRVFLASVAGSERTDALLARLSAANLPVQRVSSTQSASGVRNGYATPTSLGVDRWLSAIAAHAIWPQQDVVIVAAGTALTVDALSADGEFLGGSISPGVQTMLKALHVGTGQLPQVTIESIDDTIPRSTHHAIARGVLDAALGAVVFARARLASQCAKPPVLVLHGGDCALLLQTLRQAPTISADLVSTAQLRENLVLDGLAVVAGCPLIAERQSNA